MSVALGIHTTRIVDAQLKIFAKDLLASTSEQSQLQKAGAYYHLNQLHCCRLASKRSMPKQNMTHIRLLYLVAVLATMVPILNAQINDFPGALVVDRNSPTKTMIGYAVWWGNSSDDSDGGSYSWAKPHQYDPVYNALHRATETQKLQNGEGIDVASAPYSNRIIAVPEDGNNEVRYRSNDPTTIQRHHSLLRELGIDIVALDLTNGVWHLFDAGSTKHDNMHLKATAAIYSIYNNPENDVRIVPVVGCQIEDGLHRDLIVSPIDNKTPPQRALEWLYEKMKANPRTVVMYEGKPLVIMYSATSGYTVDQVLNTLSPDLRAKLTIRVMVGYSDDQPPYWETNVADKYKPFTRLKEGVWTWLDRLYNTNRDSFASYTLSPGAGKEDRMEFVSINGMSAPVTNTPLLTYREGAIYHQMLTIARRGNPIFLFNAHFNYFLAHDSGFTKALSRDAEPNNLWHRETFDVVKNAIASYRAYQSGGGTPRFLEISSRGLTGGNGPFDQLITGITIAGPTSGAVQRVVGKVIGITLARFGLPLAGVAADPLLELQSAAPAVIARNDSWRISSDLPSGHVSLNQSRAYKNSEAWLTSLNFGAPMTDTEAAVTADLQPGAYTYIAYETSGSSRIAHLRVNTLDEIGPSIISEVSTRSRVETGDRILIVGFTIDRQMTVLIQGRGPSLAPFNISPILANPEMLLFGSSGFLQSDTDIGNSPDRKAQIEAATGWPLNGNECAFIVTLQAGSYTVHLRNQSPTTSANGVGFLSVRKL